MNAGTAAAAEIEAVRLLLQRIGVSPEQLLGSPTGGSPVPTFSEYIGRVSEAVGGT
jgi:integrase/recombinase XerC